MAYPPASPRAPRPAAAPAARGPLPRVLVLAGSARQAGTSTTAAILAATLAALGHPVHLTDAESADAPPAPNALHVIDAGAELAAVHGALARNPGATLLVVTGAAPSALAAAYALAKATAPAPVEAVLVGADAADVDAAAARLDAGARHFLGRPLPLAAAVPNDPSLAVALAAGMPVHDAAAGSPAAAALHALAERVAPAAPGVPAVFAPALARPLAFALA